MCVCVYFVCVYEREIYCKELAYTIVKAAKSEICRAAGSLETQGRVNNAAAF